jgi:hypothetical protein
MWCDEAPAATCRGPTGKRILTARKSTDFLESGPTSLVAAEIHLGRTSGRLRRLAALHHSNHVPVRNFFKDVENQWLG